MDNSKTYEVINPIKIEEVAYEAGQEVTLTAEQAESLIASGDIKEKAEGESDEQS